MFKFDLIVFQWLNATADAPLWLVPLARFASMELPELLIAGAVGAFLVGDGRVRRGVMRIMLAMLIALPVARLLQQGFPMPRPFMLGLGTQWLEHGGSPGFPSTHASVAFAFAFAAAMASRSLWLAAALLVSAALIGWSRVCLGLHFPSDVLAGLLVGATAAWLSGLVPMVRLWPADSRQTDYRPARRSAHETLA